MLFLQDDYNNCYYQVNDNTSAILLVSSCSYNICNIIKKNNCNINKAVVSLDANTTTTTTTTSNNNNNNDRLVASS